MIYRFEINNIDNSILFLDKMGVDYHYDLYKRYGTFAITKATITIDDRDIDITDYYKQYYDTFNYGVKIDIPALKICDYNIPYCKIVLNIDSTSTISESIVYDNDILKSFIYIFSTINIATIYNNIDLGNTDLLDLYNSYLSVLSNINYLTNSDVKAIMYNISNNISNYKEL